MLSHHPSGLEVIAAPNRPAEMRTFDPDTQRSSGEREEVVIIPVREASLADLQRPEARRAVETRAITPIPFTLGLRQKSAPRWLSSCRTVIGHFCFGKRGR